MMPIAYDTEQRIQNIENSIRRIEEVLMGTTMHTGNHRTYHEPIEMDGYWGALSQLLSHGKFGINTANQIDKACLRVGESSAYCIDEVRQTGPLGVSKGVNGKFLSQVDSLPAGTTVEVS